MARRLRVPQLIAVAGVLPLLLLLLWLTWHVAQKNREVASWPQVHAQVVEVTDDHVRLQFFWRDELVRGDVRREYAFAKLAPFETIDLLANPSNPAELSATGFGDVWAGTVALGVVSLFVAIVFAFLMRAGEGGMSPRARLEFERVMRDARTGGSGITADAVPQEDDDRPIEMREPRQSWKANVFWGVLLGSIAIAPAAFAPADASVLEKYGSVALGVAWMAFMGVSAWRNFGRSVRFDGDTITLSQPFLSKRIALADVTSAVREDVRQQLRDIEAVGVSRWNRSRQLDTRARMIVYVLYDSQGKPLLRLDEGMEPAAEMQRFLRRLARRGVTVSS